MFAFQDWFGDSSTASSPFDAFGGGLVRVDDFGGVDDLRRNAWSDVEPPRAVQLLTANGHSGRQFAAYYARMDSLKATVSPSSSRALHGMDNVKVQQSGIEEL